MLDVLYIVKATFCQLSCYKFNLISSGDGNVYGWGNNEYGQVGVASDDEQLGEPVPLNLSGLDGRIVSMAAGGAFTAYLTGNVDV